MGAKSTVQSYYIQASPFELEGGRMTSAWWAADRRRPIGAGSQSYGQRIRERPSKVVSFSRWNPCLER